MLLSLLRRGGKIIVTTSQKEKFCQISIRDTGIGIPKDKLKDLMNPYVTAHHAADNIEESTGLGLSITKSLVSLHDGQMEFHSEEGEGTEVIIRLLSNKTDDIAPN